MPEATSHVSREANGGNAYMRFKRNDLPFGRFELEGGECISVVDPILAMLCYTNANLLLLLPLLLQFTAAQVSSLAQARVCTNNAVARELQVQRAAVGLRVLFSELDAGTTCRFSMVQKLSSVLFEWRCVQTAVVCKRSKAVGDCTGYSARRFYVRE